MSIDSIRLAEMIGDALERTAFVLCEPVENDEPALDELAAVEFTGVRAGIVILAASRGFCAELAAGLLGAEPDEVTERDGREALAELANMAAGSVVAALGGERDRIRLTLPRPASRDEFDAALGRGVTATLDSVGEPLRIVLLHAA